jgi:hypothetical protein
MRRARIAAVALLAYPRDVRLSSGAEMLDTVLDISNGSAWVLARESLALVRAGLRTRVRLNTQVGAKRLAADVCAQAATVWGALSLTSSMWLFMAVRRSPDFTELGYLTLIGVTIAFALLGYDRIAGLCGLGWMVYLFEVLVAEDSNFGRHLQVPALGVHELAVLFVPFVGYIVMILSPRPRILNPRRVVWLAGAILVVVAMRSHPDVGVGPTDVLLMAILCAGLLVLPADPRLAIACVIVLAGFEISKLTAGPRVVTTVPTSWAIAAAPLVLVAATLRLRQTPR